MRSEVEIEDAISTLLMWLASSSWNYAERCRIERAIGVLEWTLCRRDDLAIHPTRVVLPLLPVA